MADGDPVMGGWISGWVGEEAALCSLHGLKTQCPSPAWPLTGRICPHDVTRDGVREVGAASLKGHPRALGSPPIAAEGGEAERGVHGEASRLTHQLGLGYTGDWAPGRGGCGCGCGCGRWGGAAWA